MVKFSYTEDDLVEACELIIQSMISTLPEPEACGFSFSDTFLAKMNNMIQVRKHRIAQQKLRVRIAVFFGVVILSISLVLSMNADVRATVFGWVRDVYEDRIQYYFWRQERTNDPVNYAPGWIPEGFEEIDHYADEAINMIYFQDDSGTNDISFFCQRLDNESTTFTEYYGTQGDYVLKHTNVNGFQADYFQAQNGSIMNNLIWTDEDAGLVFMIDSNLEFEDIMHIAESIYLD